MSRVALIAGAGAAFIAVGLGAFGAHGLRDRLDAAQLAIWQTAVHYQFYHALALLVLGIWMQVTAQTGRLIVAAFLLGIILFSGSLYALVLSGKSALGAITPVGGMLFLLGWGAWIVRLIKVK